MSKTTDGTNDPAKASTPMNELESQIELRESLRIKLYEWTDSDDVVKELEELLLPFIKAINKQTRDETLDDLLEWAKVWHEKHSATPFNYYGATKALKIHIDLQQAINALTNGDDNG